MRSWLVGGDNLHPFAANIYPRKSRGGRHVAGLVRDGGALGGMGTFCERSNAEHPNIEHRTLNGLLVDFLYFARLRVSGEGADWMDAVLNGCDRAKIYRQEHFAARFKFVRGLLLMLVLVCLWGIPALIRHTANFSGSGSENMWSNVRSRRWKGMGHRPFGCIWRLLPFYFVDGLVSFFPWSIKLPALWKNLRAQRDATDQFLLAGALIIFGIFTLVQTKLPHYTLPAFPLLALLVARRFELFTAFASAPDRDDRGLSGNRAFSQPVPRKTFSKLQSCPRQPA